MREKPVWRRFIPVILAMATLTVAAASCQESPGGEGPLDAVPPPSAGHVLLYHDSLGSVLLLNAGLGSMDDSHHTGEPARIWAWRGRRWVVLDSNGPPMRNLAGVAYDSRRNRVVMHGGSSVGGATLAETWEWGGGGWELRDPNGPGPRDHTVMAYDPLRGRTVLFGGQVRVDSFPGETWEWDGSRWTVAATSGPAPRVHHGMQFDSASGRVILFGGYQPNVRDLGDVWAWNGAQWTPLGQGLPRTHLVLSYHGRLATVVAVGGMGSNGAAPLLSVWNGSSWVNAGGPGPAPRYLAAAAYDAARRVLVLFGGGNPSGSNLLADTWEHDGTTWTRGD